MAESAVMQTNLFTRNEPYVGRFAPSPTGPLHAGSLVAALASYLDARAHGGRWLVRMEDVDQQRTVPGAAESILQTLAAFGMHADGEVLWQSTRGPHYEQALQTLGNLVYPCSCSRREIADSLANAMADSIAQAGMQSPIAQPYPGTCRHGMAPGKNPRAWRLRVPDRGEAGERISIEDRACGAITQHLSQEAGDFILRRADGFWAYQLAVVVDDAAQGVTHVVRGMDLLDSTPRQIYLQRKLGLPTPHYLHVPLVLDAQGRKLSKQDGSAGLSSETVIEQLIAAAAVLNIDVRPGDSLSAFWQDATAKWAVRYGM